jgi:sirohydrochlorin cobaltochelatase
MNGIVLFAHGSRDPLWHKPMEAVAASIRQRSTHSEVVCAYLELSTPDLANATQTLLAKGVQTVTIIPMFLGVGRHAREDLPELVHGLTQAYPQMSFELLPAIGEHPAMTALMADIAAGSV